MWIGWPPLAWWMTPTSPNNGFSPGRRTQQEQALALAAELHASVDDDVITTVLRGIDAGAEQDGETGTRARLRQEVHRHRRNAGVSRRLVALAPWVRPDLGVRWLSPSWPPGRRRV